MRVKRRQTAALAQVSATSVHTPNGRIHSPGEGAGPAVSGCHRVLAGGHGEHAAKLPAVPITLP